MKLRYILIILSFFIFSSCGRKSSIEINKDRVYASTYKYGSIGTGPCPSCLIMEINKYSVLTVFSRVDESIEECEGSARYNSFDGSELVIPTTLNEEIIWTLNRTQGGGDFACFPDSVDLYVERISNDEIQILFSSSASEYILKKKD